LEENPDSESSLLKPTSFITEVGNNQLIAEENRPDPFFMDVKELDNRSNALTMEDINKGLIEMLRKQK
jgi:hypothetical protein